MSEGRSNLDKSEHVQEESGTETLYRGFGDRLCQTHTTQNITFATPLAGGKNMMRELNNKIHVLNKNAFQ